MKILANKTITDVPGILASGIATGIKKDGKKDLCIIYSKYKAASAAAFTSNKVKGAPIIVNMKNIENSNTQAIVVNSGNANSCTGEEGISNAYKMVEAAAKCLKLSNEEVLVASTGILGVQLPMDILLPGIEKACSSLSDNAGADPAEAILTSDRTTKTITVEFEIQGQKIMMSGIAKGSTMIHPNMGTLLCFIVTDANISKIMLHKALKASVDRSFNMVSVDGDTSTNDMAIILANGSSAHSQIDSGGENYTKFCEALEVVTTELAKMIAKDGDGCTKLLEVTVISGKTVEAVRKSARSIVSSNLVKTTMFGGEPDWSRLVCALGYSEADYNPNNFDITIKNSNNELQIVKSSLGVNFDKERAKKILSSDHIRIEVNLKDGTSKATAWGCDLTYDYVKANAYLK